jgi:hypothetical protein
MNGIPLLLLATTVGMDFGWQPASDNPNMLEYIVQLSPEEIQLLNTGKEELFSGIPRELKGRIDRVVIRMGREKLPQTPSLEQLRMTASVAGNPSILQAGGSNQGSPVVPSTPPVGTSPPANATGFSTIDPPKILPSTPLTTTGSPPAFASPATSPASGSYDLLGSGAYEDLLKTQAANASTGGPLLPSNPSSFTNAAPSSINGSSGQLLPSTVAGAAAPPTGTFSSAAIGAPNTTGQILPRDPVPTTGVQNPFPSTSANPNNLPNGGWASVNPAATGANGTNRPPQGSVFNNFANGNMGNNPQIFPTGSVQGNNPLPNNPQANNTVAYNSNPQTQGYASGNINPAGNNNPPQYNNQPNTPPSTNWGPPPAVNGNNTSFVSDRVPNPNGGLLNRVDNEESLSDKVAAETAKVDAATSELKRSGWENILQVLFLLSIVVNFYLGVLMHKLVMRYRNLLASVRTSSLAT